MQILKMFQWFQPIINDHIRHRNDVINDVVQCEYREYDEQSLQIIKPRLLLFCFSVFFHM